GLAPSGSPERHAPHHCPCQRPRDPWPLRRAPLRRAGRHGRRATRRRALTACWTPKGSCAVSLSVLSRTVAKTRQASPGKSTNCDTRIGLAGLTGILPIKRGAAGIPIQRNSTPERVERLHNARPRRRNTASPLVLSTSRTTTAGRIPARRRPRPLLGIPRPHHLERS